MNTEGKVYGAQLSKDAKAGAALFHCCARQQNKLGQPPKLVNLSPCIELAASSLRCSHRHA